MAALPEFFDLRAWFAGQSMDPRGLLSCEIGPALGVPFEGRLHNALDDARSLAAATWALLARGARRSQGPRLRAARRVSDEADRLIAALDLKPHPEGGHFRETFRDANVGRAHSTAIYFLLKAGEVSRWHRVDARRGLALLSRRAAGIEDRQDRPGCCWGLRLKKARRRKPWCRRANGRRRAVSAITRW